MNEIHPDELIDRLHRLAALEPAPEATADALARVRRELIEQTAPERQQVCHRQRQPWSRE
jgi:hypothetical protein